MLDFKTNHLAYTEPRWYGSRISTDCQQKLLFTKHDTSVRFLLVTFLEKKKREGCRDNLLAWKCIRDITVFVKITLHVLLASGFYIIKFNSRRNQIISVKEKVSLRSPTQIETVREETMLQVLLLLLTLLLPLAIQIFKSKFNK